ncbi:MAG TPA: EamA family transporter RarD [Marmoricola sp.]|nr:EamA family transporter RarD [Marmoricola sp.]
MTEGRRGFLMGLGAYSLWGLFPLYWPFLEPAGALEILAHRVVWSAVVMAVLVLLVRRTAELRRALTSPRTVVLMAAASAVIGANWGLFIWGVNNDHVIETSLGYFINPLVTVVLGVVVLGERLRPVQWASLGLAAVAVTALTVDYGRPPWLALALAGSFGAYGLIKKTAGVGAVAGLTVETVLLAPVALGFLVVLADQGEGHFTGHGVDHALLLTTTGIVTAVPLLLFGGAAARIPLSTLGLLQYLTPSIQFLLGLLVFGEPMPATRWIGFILIWTALVLFTLESLRQHRLTRLRVEASAC